MRTPSLAACSFALFFAVLINAALSQSAAPESTESTSETAPPLPSADLEAGRLLAYTCQGCHGIAGYKNAYPNYRVPKIGGQSAEYLVEALTGYRYGTRQHPTMQAQSLSLSQQQIENLAAYLSTLK